MKNGLMIRNRSPILVSGRPGLSAKKRGLREEWQG
jgi:ribosomal protein S6E (S10)